MREAAGKLAAIAVLLLCAYVLLQVVLGFVSTVAWTAVTLLAVVAVLWALNRLL
jgi:hypothetical protein